MKIRANLLQADSIRIPIASNTIGCVVTSPPYYGLRDYRVPGQIGLEPTLSEYIEHLCLVFDEVWRVLRDDGTCWIVLGDTFVGGGRGGNSNAITGRGKNMSIIKSKRNASRWGGGNVARQPGFKPLDLMGVPWRVAIALQERGWWLRRDNIWAKTTWMPESVMGWRWEPHKIRKDDEYILCPGCDDCLPNNGLVLRKGAGRSTTSHEYIFHFTKSETYYYDTEAIREAQSPASFERAKRARTSTHKRLKAGSVPPGLHTHSLHRKRAHGEGFPMNPTGRNRRSIWKITPYNYSGAHFAAFPPAIPELCIKAGTSEKGQCPICGAPWARVIEKDFKLQDDVSPSKAMRGANNQKSVIGDKLDNYPRGHTRVMTKGWLPTCEHKDIEPIPQIVLDPFGGSGTTAQVAAALGRIGICIDLSWKYLQLARERTGLKALAEWEQGKPGDTDYHGLPLFEQK